MPVGAMPRTAPRLGIGTQVTTQARLAESKSPYYATIAIALCPSVLPSSYTRQLVVQPLSPPPLCPRRHIPHRHPRPDPTPQPKPAGAAARRVSLVVAYVSLPRGPAVAVCCRCRCCCIAPGKSHPPTPPTPPQPARPPATRPPRTPPNWPRRHPAPALCMLLRNPLAPLCHAVQSKPGCPRMLRPGPPVTCLIRLLVQPAMACLLPWSARSQR